MWSVALKRSLGLLALTKDLPVPSMPYADMNNMWAMLTCEIVDALPPAKHPLQSAPPFEGRERLAAPAHIEFPPIMGGGDLE